MVDNNALIGSAEVIGAVVIIVGTFVFNGVINSPLAWRILAIFMGVAGLARLR